MAVAFRFDGEVKVSTGGQERARGVRTLESIEQAAEETLGLPVGSFDIYDSHGKITLPGDVQRAIKAAHAGGTEAIFEVKEHNHYVRIKKLEKQMGTQAQKILELEGLIQAERGRTDTLVENAKKEAREMFKKTDTKITHEIIPTIEDLCRDRTQLQKETRNVQEKLASININELREMCEQCNVLREEVKSALKRVEVVETNFNRDKGRMETDIKRNHEDLTDLSKYISGKIDVCIEADGDLKREIQLTNERMQLLADDLRLHQDSLRDLTLRTNGALEESEELRTLLGTVREDNMHLRSECGQVRTRVHCIEGAATEEWKNFAPGILYFRRFHFNAKGVDVQLSSDLSFATGRGFLAQTGVVVGTDEGLCVADGPCRRFGTAGSFSSYFEIQIDEICAAPAGAGGLYVGVTLQSGDEINEHPRKEFDGWLVGGPGKALIYRAATQDRGYDDAPPPSALQPAAFGSDIESSAAEKAARAIRMLREAMPPKPKGEVREYDCVWRSDKLRMMDRVGVLFKCHRDGGARLRVLVNQKKVCDHEFIEAPKAEAMGLLTPVVRLAGTGKTIQLLPGLTPPGFAIAD